MLFNYVQLQRKSHHHDHDIMIPSIHHLAKCLQSLAVLSKSGEQCSPCVVSEEFLRWKQARGPMVFNLGSAFGAAADPAALFFFVLKHSPGLSKFENDETTPSRGTCG